MSEPETKTDALFVRISPDTKRRFAAAAERFGMSASELTRELVMGFIEGRVTVTPPDHVKEFYNVPGSQD